MGVDEGKLQTIDRCRHCTGKLSNNYIVRNLFVYSTIQYGVIVVIIYDNECH